MNFASTCTSTILCLLKHSNTNFFKRSSLLLTSQSRRAPVLLQIRERSFLVCQAHPLIPGRRVVASSQISRMDTQGTSTPSSSIPEELRSQIFQRMRYKERSHQTLLTVHKPALAAISPVSTTTTTTADLTLPGTASSTNDDPSPPQTSFNVIYIGDSMLERLKTTGVNTSLHKFPQSYNLGVGGDRIENVLYRLHEGYIDLLKDRPTKLWVLHIGSNNLTRRGLSDSHIANYSLLLQTLLHLSPKSQVMVTGIFNRKDMKPEIVAQWNIAIESLVGDMNEEFISDKDGKGRLVWVKPPAAFSEEMLEDHAHLNVTGYEMWADYTHPKILELL